MSDLSPEMRQIIAARDREARLGCERDQVPLPKATSVANPPREEAVDVLNPVTTWTSEGLEVRGRDAAGHEVLVVNINYIRADSASFVGARVDNGGPGPRVYRPVTGWAEREG